MNKAIAAKMQHNVFHVRFMFNTDSVICNEIDNKIITKMKNTLFIIDNAVYDTGCNTSLISADTMHFKDKRERNKFQDYCIYSAGILLYCGTGVEGRTADLSKLKRIIKKINNIKLQCRKEMTDPQVDIDKDISQVDMQYLKASKNVRYEVPASDISIEGELVSKGCYIQVAFNIGPVNLIGMEIIKKLVTYIFSYKKDTYLIIADDDNKIHTAKNQIINQYNIKHQNDNPDNEIIDFNEVSDTVLNAFSVKEKIEESKKANQNKQV